MKLDPIQIEYFSELGEIVEITEKLKSIGLQVYFDRSGIRVSETYGKGAKDPYYKTAAELRAFYNGLQDGFWHAIKVDKNLFQEPLK